MSARLYFDGAKATERAKQLIKDLKMLSFYRDSFVFMFLKLMQHKMNETALLKWDSVEKI